MVTIDADFCPACGTRLGRVTVEGRDRRHCPACDVVVWRNPAPTAGVVVRDGDRVLLARRGQGPREGRWTVPGGFMEVDETAPEGAARELREETGVFVAPGDLRLLATHHNPEGRVPTVLVRYVVDREATSGEPEGGSDADAARFWSREALADLEMHPANRRFARLALDRAEPDR